MPETNFFTESKKSDSILQIEQLKAHRYFEQNQSHTHEAKQTRTLKKPLR